MGTIGIFLQIIGKQIDEWNMKVIITEIKRR